MKNLILILISFFLVDCQKDNSDNNDKTNLFVDNSKVWYVSEYPNPCPSCIWPHKIVLGKDTIINSDIYKTILDYHDDAIESNCKPSNLGYIRETPGKKVYWHIKLFNEPASDILIYDFNAQINDTIDNWIVTKIDTINILNINRRRITLRNCEQTEKYWIGGIGNMSDLLSYASRTICDFKTGIVMMDIGGSGYKQNCVKQGDEYIYKDSLATDCWTYQGDTRLNNR
jgi:hypothetical protein